jgi:hypothetical protein
MVRVADGLSYKLFSEGFATADLKDAKAPLDELAEWQRFSVKPSEQGWALRQAGLERQPGSKLRVTAFRGSWNLKRSSLVRDTLGISLIVTQGMNC